MKKTRFIPYGYTMRNGRTVIEHGEADIIRYIFDEYIKGASLKDLAEELTARKVPYTEKTEVWDKARIARIIDNAKYTGSRSTKTAKCDRYRALRGSAKREVHRLPHLRDSKPALQRDKRKGANRCPYRSEEGHAHEPSNRVQLSLFHRSC